MKQLRSLLTIFTITFALVITGCGGTDEKATEENGPAESEAAEDVAEDTSPETMARKAADIYKQALKETIEAMSGDPKPEEAEVKEEVTSIRDTYAAQLVEIGKLREKKGEEWGAKFDTTLTRAFMKKDFRDLQKEYAELQTNYSRGEAGKITAAINILTEYANFELLRKQKPEEAARYGVAEAEETGSEAQ